MKKRTKKKRINCWIYLSVWSALNDYAEQKGSDMTKEVEEALRQYLGIVESPKRRVN